MPYRLEEVQRSHYIRLERSYRVHPGDRWQALCSEMEDVVWLELRKDALHALPVAQIALHKSRLHASGRQPARAPQNAADYLPALGMKKSDQMGPDKAIGASNKCGVFRCHTGLQCTLSTKGVDDMERALRSTSRSPFTSSRTGGITSVKAHPAANARAIIGS